MTTQSIRCHYDVLGVERDADDKTIKQAHRKLALKYHPDKNYGNESAGKEFRLIQQAYECLSDVSERKYYDQHRESILRGFKPGDGQEYDVEFLFDVTPFHFSGCYDGYSDEEGGFFDVYQDVFMEILAGERYGWVSEGNVDETEMSNADLPADFGDGSSDWKDVSHFYNQWGSFTSCLSFAWADQYDPREAESRFVRRRIDDENKKLRKSAKKDRSDEIINFVAFVKRRDPRVKAAREAAEKEKVMQEKARKEEMARRKQETKEKREKWLEEREIELREAELEDLDAGRVRLADLDDSDDDYYGKGRKKGKKGKKRGKKNRSQWSSDEEDSVADEEGEDGEEGEPEKEEEGNETNALDALEALDKLDISEEDEFSESSFEEEPEPKIWKCEICKKTFKSEAQFNNHLKSKKHKEAFKKWHQKNAK